VLGGGAGGAGAGVIVISSISGSRLRGATPLDGDRRSCTGRGLSQKGAGGRLWAGRRVAGPRRRAEGERGSERWGKPGKGGGGSREREEGLEGGLPRGRGGRERERGGGRGEGGEGGARRWWAGSARRG